MSLQKISETVAYKRYIPEIFGKENVYDLEHLLSSEDTVMHRFVAREFSGHLMINTENRIDFYPATNIEAFQTLVEDNDEIGLSEALKGSDALVLNGVVVPLMRPGFDIYGHWLLDLLPKLSVFERINPKIKYTILVDERCPKWAIKLIESLFHNFESIVKITIGDIVSGNFFLVTPIRHHDFISEFAKMNTLALSGVAPARNVYISRKHMNLHHRQLENSAKIERLFQSKGFELVYPEELSISEQIKLFSEVKILAGEAGSGLHNSIFCPNTTVIINVQSGRQNHFIQAGLCERYGQEVIYVGSKTKTDDWGSSFKAKPKDCKLAIKRAISLLP